MIEASSPHEDEGLQDADGMEPEQLATGQMEGATEPPHDFPMAVEDYGTTPAEQQEGESLDGRLSRELPEAYPTETQEVGRLVEPDEGARTDVDKEMVASDVGTDRGGFTAEEAAMHVEPEA